MCLLVCRQRFVCRSAGEHVFFAIDFGVCELDFFSSFFVYVGRRAPAVGGVVAVGVVIVVYGFGGRNGARTARPGISQGRAVRGPTTVSDSLNAVATLPNTSIGLR